MALPRVPELFDLSLAIGGHTLRYPGDPAPRVETLASLERGDALTVSAFSLHCHVGTHVDAPAHFVAGGLTVEQLDERRFYGPALVVDVGEVDCIDPQALAGHAIRADQHLLIKSRNSALLARSTFTPSHCYLAPDAAQLIAERAPLSVGFDYYSLDPPTAADYPAHGILARRGLPVFVALNLAAVPPGEYLFVGLPLPLAGVEAAPVRAILLRSNEG